MPTTTFSKLTFCISASLALALVAVMAFLGSGLRLVSSATQSGKQSSFRSVGESTPYIKLQESRELQADYAAAGTLSRSDALRAGDVTPLALASGDVNGDGYPDLVCGYSSSTGGILTLYRGDPGAFAPQDPAVIRGIAEGQFPDPFLKDAVVHELPEAPDFVSTGDFNRDGKVDIVVASRGGGTLYLLEGQEGGGFSQPVWISLSGSVTAMITGGFSNRDGLTDLILGIDTAGEASLLVYGGPRSILETEPKAYLLPAKASSLALGRLDDDPFEDIAILANGKVLGLHGRDDTRVSDSLASKKAGTIETIESAFSVRAFALGEFIWDRDSRTEMAVLGDDGTVHILARGELDTRPWTQEEALEKRRALQRLRDQEKDGRRESPSVAANPPVESMNWTVAEVLPAPAATSGGSSAQPVLLSTRMSSQPSDDLLVMNQANRQFQVMYKPGPTQDDAQPGRSAVSLESEDEVAAVLPMRVNVDGRPGLVVMSKGHRTPSIIMLVAATFTVTRADDPAPNGCVVGDCSLREAVIAANANVGADTIVFNAGINPTLTITSAGGFENLAATGDLDINDSVTITGNPTTISTTYTSTCGDCKVFGVGQNSTPGLTVSVNNSTIQNGFNQLIPAQQGLFFETGGGIDFFLFGTGSTYSMTNCTVNNNQVAGSLLSHGAGINIDSQNTGTPAGASAGTVTLTNVSCTNNTSSTFGGGIVLAADKHNVTMTDFSATGNTATGADGGGIWIRHSFGGTINMSKTGPGTANVSNNSGTQGGGISVVGNQVVTITDITISNNTATGTVGTALGGGIAIINLGAGGVVGSTTLTGVSVSTNHADAGAAAQGGGVYFNGNYPATVSNCSITSNTSDTGGGVIHGGSGSNQILTLNSGTSITSNTATLVGGGFANINSVSAITSLAGTTISGNTSGGGDGINQAGGTITGTGTNNVNGGDSVNISGGTFNYTSGTFNLTGNFTNSGGTFNQTGGTTVFNGTVAQSLGGTTPSLFNNLTINKTGTLTLGVNTNVGADLTLTAGTFDLSTFTANRTAAGGTLTVSNGTTLRIGGTNTLPSNYAAHSIGATSIIEYSGANQNVAPLNSLQRYGNLLTSGSGTKTLAGAIGIATSLTIGAGTTLDASVSNFAINIAGNWTNNGTFTPRSGTVTFDGTSGTQTLVGTTTFFDLTLNNPGATTNFGSTTTTISHNLVTTAGTMNGGTSTIIFTGNPGAISGAATKNFNNLVINAGAVVSNSTGGNIVIANDYTNNGTFTQAAGLSTTFSTGDGTHSLLGNGTTTFGVVVISGSTTVDAGAHSFNVVGASFDVTGTFTGNTSTVTFNGGIAQAILGSGSKNFGGLTINNANGVTVNDVASVVDAVVGGALTLTTDLTIAPGAILQQTGSSAGTADAIGTVRRTDLDTSSRAFGNPNVTISVQSGTAPNPMDISLAKVVPPDFTTAVTRTYTLTPTGGSGISATLKLHYLNAELNGNAETKLALWKKIAGTWVAQGRTGVVDTVNKAVTLVGVTSFSDWTLAAVEPVTITKAFGAASIPLNGVTTLTLTLTNPNTNTPLNGISFSDNFPAGLQVANPTGIGSTCTGTWNATPGDTTLNFLGGTLAAGASCTLTVNVTGTTVGPKSNTTNAPDAIESGTGLPSNTAILEVVGPPTISKAFGAPTIPLGGTTTLTFTITNPNPTTNLTGVGFTDVLPAGLTVATSGPTPTCGGTLTTTAPGTITLTGATVAQAGGTCVFSVTVTGAAAGVQNNTSGAVTSTEGGTGNTASASVTVVAPPAISKAFNPTSIAVGGTSTLTFTITNPNTTTALTGVAFTDVLPAGLTVATSGPTATCGGTLTTTSPSTITLSGATIAASGTCVFSVTVTGTTGGVKTNTTGAVTSANGGTGNTATAIITVATPPTVSKAFGVSSVVLGGTTSLTFTINNPNTSLALTGVSFTDTLPAGITVATSGPTPACGGTVTTTAPSTITFTGGTLAVTETCQFAVTVTGSTGGVWNNTTGVISSTESGAGATSNTATLTVVGSPTIAKAFGAPTIPLGGTTTLTFTITNPNATTNLTGVGFTDVLPAGLTVATSGPTPTCGGTLTTTAPGTITLTGATVAQAGGTCVFSVTVTGAAAGVQNNTSGAVTSTEGGTGNTASASITVVAPPAISKAFNPTNISLGGTSTLTFTITNPNTTEALTGVAFTDVLPAGLTVATSGPTATCGGTLTTTSPSTITLSGATIAASGTCVFSVTVTGTTGGVKTNTTGAVTSANGGTGNTATAIISVAAAPTVNKAFGVSSVVLGGTTSLTFTINNPNTSLALTGVSFTDTLPAGITVATSGPTPACGGTVTTTAPSTITFTGGTLAVTETCQFAVTVTGSTGGVWNNTTGVISSTESGAGATSNTATLTVVGSPTIAKAFGAPTIPLGGATTLTFTITNPNATTNLTGVGFTDVLPAGLTVATSGPTPTCGGTLTTTAPGTITLTGATVAQAGGTCIFSVTVTGAAAGVQNNTSGAVTSTEGGTGNTASASITVVAPPAISKAFNPTNISLGGTSTLTFTITNPNTTTALTGVAFTDVLPAGLTVATSGPTATCGGTLTTTSPSTITLSGATIAASGTCVFSVTVTGTTGGVKTNTTGAVTSANGGTGNTATAIISVAAAPTVNKAFGVSSVVLGGTTSLTFTINNPNTSLALTGVSFTDTLPAGITVATSGPTPACGGTVTTTAPSTITFTGGTLAVTETCQFAVTVTGSTGGVWNNTTGVISSTESGAGATSNTATLTVVGPPSIAKAFDAATIPLGGTSVLTFTITNSNTTTTLNGVAFTDVLPAGLTVVNGSTPACGGGTLTTTAPNTISFSGGSIAQSSNCQITVTVTGATAGVKNNTSGAVTSTNGGTGNTAQASITVVAPPVISKAFGAVNIPPNGTTSLTFTITNPNTTVALTGVGFTDVLPAGLTVATSGPTATCGGTLTTTSPSTITLSGATIAASGSCVFSVTVTGTTPGPKNNTTGAVTSANGGTGNTASATVTVDSPPVAKCKNVTVSAGPTCVANASIDDGSFDPDPGDTITLSQSPPGPYGLGDTLVTLTVTDNHGVSSQCQATVTVVDTTPPTITCPASVTIRTPEPGDPCVVATFPDPVVTDNCPNPTVVCTPPSGSCFPVGTTTVTCIATDGSGNTASCTFKVTAFDLCLQDDSNSNTVLLLNSATGDYLFCCNGVNLAGKGKMAKAGNTFKLTHNPSDRRVQATIDGSAHKGTASLQAPPGVARCSIIDRNTQNNSCVCQ